MKHWRLERTLPDEGIKKIFYIRLDAHASKLSIKKIWHTELARPALGQFVCDRRELVTFSGEFVREIYAALGEKNMKSFLFFIPSLRVQIRTSILSIPHRTGF